MKKIDKFKYGKGYKIIGFLMVIVGVGLFSILFIAPSYKLSMQAVLVISLTSFSIIIPSIFFFTKSGTTFINHKLKTIKNKHKSINFQDISSLLIRPTLHRYTINGSTTERHVWELIVSSKSMANEDSKLIFLGFSKKFSDIFLFAAKLVKASEKTLFIRYQGLELAFEKDNIFKNWKEKLATITAFYRDESTEKLQRVEPEVLYNVLTDMDSLNIDSLTDDHTPENSNKIYKFVPSKNNKQIHYYDSELFYVLFSLGVFCSALIIITTAVIGYYFIATVLTVLTGLSIAGLIKFNRRYCWKKLIISRLNSTRTPESGTIINPDSVLFVVFNSGDAPNIEICLNTGNSIHIVTKPKLMEPLHALINREITESAESIE